MPGIETTVPIQWDPAETVSYQNVAELVSIPGLNWTPQTISKAETLKEKATRVSLRRDVWNLEFSFLPMRMISIDVPQPGGKMPQDHGLVHGLSRDEQRRPLTPREARGRKLGR